MDAERVVSIAVGATLVCCGGLIVFLMVTDVIPPGLQPLFLTVVAVIAGSVALLVLGFRRPSARITEREMLDIDRLIRNL
jgi:hypothetical protein